MRIFLNSSANLPDGLPVAVNGKSVRALGDGLNPDNPGLIRTNAIRYNTDHGLWQQRTLMFDASAEARGKYDDLHRSRG